MVVAERSRLERWFVEHGVTEEQLVVARHTARGIESSVGAALVVRGTLDQAQLTTALSEVYGLPEWDGRFDDALIDRLTLPLCRRELVVPVSLEGTRLLLAVAEPPKHDIVEAAQFACRARAVDFV